MGKEAIIQYFDAMVIGGGIAGGESALNLANNGYKVVIVEKDLSIGGKMIMLSKVFPTLDCSACITTPKVSEISRHQNITVLTETDVNSVVKIQERHFRASLTRRPRYVVAEDCTGCQKCEEVCPVIVKDQYQYNLIGRKAAYIPFSIASPKIAAIDLENCTLCGACERACPSRCIDFTQEAVEYIIDVKTVVVATGFKLFDPDRIERYGSGKLKNVLTSMQMERQLAPTRPFNTILRPSDGKVPDKIAYVLCAGSRDDSAGNPICSQVCCMYSIKQAQLLMGALPMADITIYYIDIRAFGKGYDEFYEQAKGMGVNFIKGKIGKITPGERDNVILRYEDVSTGKIKEAEHDMAVLSVGVLATDNVSAMFTENTLRTDTLNYIYQSDPLLNPARTSIEGVFVSGAASGPKDIPDSILSAGSAAGDAISYLKQLH
jgi:heterodisulfide reductase subunit A